MSWNAKAAKAAKKYHSFFAASAFNREFAWVSWKGSTVAAEFGIVTETLPSAMYRVKLDGGAVVLAHIADRMDRNFVRILIGDRVRIELSADVTRGRIVEKIGT